MCQAGKIPPRKYPIRGALQWLLWFPWLKDGKPICSDDRPDMKGEEGDEYGFDFHGLGNDVLRGSTQE
jgi:hypothetical protein